MGRLTADPELRHTPNNIAVTSFSIAINRSYQKAGSEPQADFINIVAWRQTADFVCKYFKKGQMIAVNGSIQTRSYTDNNGNKRTAFEVVADNVSFTESRRDSGSNPAGNYNNNNGGSYNNNYNNNGYNNAPANNFNEPAPAYSSGSSNDFEEIIGDDDLPF